MPRRLGRFSSASPFLAPGTMDKGRVDPFLGGGGSESRSTCAETCPDRASSPGGRGTGRSAGHEDGPPGWKFVIAPAGTSCHAAHVSVNLSGKLVRRQEWNPCTKAIATGVCSIAACPGQLSRGTPDDVTGFVRPFAVDTTADEPTERTITASVVSLTLLYWFSSELVTGESPR